jgi:hypothetical protein
MAPFHADVVVDENEIIVDLPEAGFHAVYFRRPGKPQLILKSRTQTDDYELLGRAWRAATDKARELGWIV